MRRSVPRRVSESKAVKPLQSDKQTRRDVLALLIADTSTKPDYKKAVADVDRLEPWERKHSERP